MHSLNNMTQINKKEEISENKILGFINKTKSLCPVCLKKIDAFIYEKDNQVYMKKKCSRHGTFDTLIWQDTADAYKEWIKYGGVTLDEEKNSYPSDVIKGCPFDCGICRNHAKDITTAALMTTNICDVNCPICFTKDSRQARYMPSNDELLSIAENYRDTYSADHPIELCGGEPTVRDDLPELVKGLKELGFDHIQLNTNGIRIADDIDFLKSLKKSGLSVVYLGFDGTDENIYLKKYGREMYETKIKAVKNCSTVKIAVVLVPVVMPGINSSILGRIIEIAKENMPAVKSVYLQPVSYFGNYPFIPSDKDRITIPEVIRQLEKQTSGEISKKHFKPGGCEHPLCSFTAFYMKDRNGTLKALTSYSPRGVTEDSAEKVREHNKKAWKYSEANTLAVGGMHFQDVWNIDTDRLKKCRICILNEDGRIIPLCSKYVTSVKGEKLYDGIS